MSRPDPVTFDTHRFVKRLTEAGMPTCQAEVPADEQVALLDTHLATHLATRQDIIPLKQDVTVLKRDMVAVKQDVAVLKAELRMVKWLVSGVGFGMIALLLKTFRVA